MKREKPKYGVWRSVRFMLAQAWKTERSVPLCFRWMDQRKRRSRALFFYFVLLYNRCQ